MIGRVRGEVIERNDSTHHCLVTISISGIGLEVIAPKADVEGALKDGAIDLYTDFVVREDAMVLYGFVSAERRSLFRMLQTVTGVGPKVALTMVATTQTHELIAAIIDGDLTFLEQVPGIGKKVASRISLELREKMSLPANRGASSKRNLRSDVISALVNLGYGEREAVAAVAHLAADVKVDVALKEALTHLNRTTR